MIATYMSAATGIEAAAGGGNSLGVCAMMDKVGRLCIPWAAEPPARGNDGKDAACDDWVVALSSTLVSAGRI